MDVERVGPDLLAGLGVVQLVRRGDDELTAASQQALRLLEQSLPIGDVLDHFEAGDEAKGGIGKGDGGRRGGEEMQIGKGIRRARLGDGLRG